MGEWVENRWTAIGGTLLAVAAGVLVMVAVTEILQNAVASFVLRRRLLQWRPVLETLALTPLQVFSAAMVMLAYFSEDPIAIGLALGLCILVVEYLRRFHDVTAALRRRNLERDGFLQKVLDSHAMGGHELATALHDGPLQGVLACKLSTDTVGAMVSPPAHAAVQDLGRRLGVVAEELRDLMAGRVLPSGADGLAAALERERDRLSRAFPDGFEFSVELSQAVDEQHETLAFQILHEAIWNAAQHSGATRLEVSVAAQDGVVELAVCDNGRGADGELLQDAYQSGHLGVATMRERATLAGGEFSIGPNGDGHGCLVRATLPLA